MILCVWIPSTSKILSKVIHGVACISISFFLYVYVIFHCMYLPQFIYLFICWWIVKVKVTQLCPTLCNPMDYTVHGILQASLLEWIATPFSRGSSQPRDRTHISLIAGRFFTDWVTRIFGLFCFWLLDVMHEHVCVKLLQSCLTLWHSIDCNPPGSFVHGILQARMLEWVAMLSSRGSSRPRNQTHVSYIYCIGRQALYH